MSATIPIKPGDMAKALFAGWSMFFLLVVSAGNINAGRNLFIFERSEMTDPPNGTRVAAYYRCSTDGQEFSIEGQREVVRKLAAQNDWEVMDEFEDEAESGATYTNRIGLQRLLDSSAAKRFTHVLVYDLSRITRGGSAEFWMLVYRLKECGVQLFCCARQRIVNEENSVLFTVDASLARSENIKRSRDATRGIHQSIYLRDQDPGRRPPFGYDHMRIEIATGREIERIRYLRDGCKQVMTPDGGTVIRIIPKGEKYPKGPSLRTELVPGAPEDVDLMRQIIEKARILGLKRLADWLNREGHLGPTGGKWSASTLWYQLRNRAYQGDRVTQRTRRGRYHTYDEDGVKAYDDTVAGQLQYMKNPESQHKIKPNTHEGLVATEQFSESRDAMSRRQGDKNWNRKGRNQDREYLLSAGFCACGRCGAGLNGTVVTSKGHKYPKYYCSANRRHGPSVCAGYSVPMDALDEFVLAEVRSSVTAPDCLAALATGLEKEFVRRLELHKPMSADEAAALKAEQAEIERTRRQIADAVKASPAAITLMAPEIERLATQAEALERKLQRAKPALDKAKIKDLVAKGVAFYQERVLGPLGALAEGEAHEVVGSSKEGEDGAVKRPTERPCTAELKELLRLLRVKLTYDPDKKEGDLVFSPFA